MTINYSDKTWMLPKISRVILAVGVVLTLLIMLIDGYRLELNYATVLLSFIFLLVTFSPFIVLAALSYKVKGRSYKSWVVFVLSFLVVLTTVITHGYIYFLLPEEPQNAQAAVALIFLPAYQLLGGGILGGTAWGIISYLEKDEQREAR